MVAPESKTATSVHAGHRGTVRRSGSCVLRPDGGIRLFGYRYFGSNQLCYGQKDGGDYRVLHDNGSYEYGAIHPSPDNRRVIFQARERFPVTYVIGTDGRRTPPAMCSLTLTSLIASETYVCINCAVL